jgi:hypothetical protein
MIKIWQLLNGKKLVIASLYWGTILPSLILLYPAGVPADINKWVVIACFFLTSIGLGHKMYKKSIEE